MVAVVGLGGAMHVIGCLSGRICVSCVRPALVDGFGLNKL